MAKAGEIVWVRFPFEGGNAKENHPALVLDEEDDGRVVLAYGSSKKVDIANPKASEVVVSNSADLRVCGLRKPTRFDLGVRARMYVAPCEKIGELPKSKLRDLFRAAKGSGLV